MRSTLDHAAVTGAWDGIVVASAPSTEVGVVALLWSARDLATVSSAPGAAADLAGAFERALGPGLPLRPRVATWSEITFVWSGPGQWLALSPLPGLAATLARVLPGAAIADQTGGRAILSLSGPRVRDVLAKGSMVDLHPRAFGVGDVAVTSIAHVGVQLWQVDEAPTFAVAVSRSFAGSFWSWLAAAAAEFGLSAVSETRR